MSKQITRGTKAAIRLDWRTERRSAYNYRDEAGAAYRRLLARRQRPVYSHQLQHRRHDPLGRLLQSNVERGHVSVVMQGYKRYRVSSQRFSKKPMNVEFVLVVDTHRKSDMSADELREQIEKYEKSVLREHSECEKREKVLTSAVGYVEIHFSRLSRGVLCDTLPVRRCLIVMFAFAAWMRLGKAVGSAERGVAGHRRNGNQLAFFIRHFWYVPTACSLDSAYGRSIVAQEP